MAVELKRFTTGVFCWVELNTTDTAGAKTFYTSLFGWNKTDIPISDTEVYTMVQVGDKQVGAISKLQEDAVKMGTPPNWFNYIAVDNADLMAAKAKELGGKVMREPTDIPPGRFAILQDPQGAYFAILKGNDEMTKA